MSRDKRLSDADLQQRVRGLLEKGQSCARCFVQVVQDERGQVPKQVVELAPALERGIGASGSVCGVFVAALLSIALGQEGRADEPDTIPSQPQPCHEWLDAFTPRPGRSGRAQLCRSLAERISAYATENYGGVECHRISGVEWPILAPGLGSLYFSEGGTQRCAHFIAHAAQAFLDCQGMATPA